MRIELTVNGKLLRADVPPMKLLLAVLREDFGFTGSKEGCGEGECGACSVIMDGCLVNACLVPAFQASGREILTIEGLGSSDSMDLLQKAFVSEGGVQCGFCTPGILMSAKALLAANPAPSEGDIREALSGNLCRCTGYRKVVDAVLAAAAELRGEEVADRTDREKPGALGRSIVKVDSLPKVLGTAQYGADLYLPDMLFGAMVPSAVAHARILRIDTSAAMAIPGVERVLTSADIPGAATYGTVVKDTPFLATGKVRYLGEPVAVVLAQDEHAARRAAAAVKVDYEELPVVFDPREAMKPEAPLVHEGGNILKHAKIRKGNVEEGFAQAAHIVTRQFVTQTAEHGYIEPEAGVAYWDGQTLVVQACSQGPHYHRGEIARMLNLPVSKVRMIQTTTGGGFGGKIDLSLQHMVALGAFLTGRPVKMVWTREESIRTSTKRHAFYMDYAIGATRNGRLIAAKAEIVGNTGAYASFGPSVLVRSATMALGPYDCPNVHVDAYAVYTNVQIAGAMRGFGAPQMSPCHEPLMDELAALCGMSSIDFRRVNMVRPGSSTVTQQVLEAGVGALATLERVVAAADLEGRGGGAQ